MGNISWNVIEEQQVRRKFTFLLFICSILVIYIHATNIEQINIDNLTSFDELCISIESYWTHVTSIAVPFFFFISGLLFFRTFKINKLLEKWGGE